MLSLGLGVDLVLDGHHSTVAMRSDGLGHAHLLLVLAEVELLVLFFRQLVVVEVSFALVLALFDVLDDWAPGLALERVVHQNLDVLLLI